MTRPRNDFTDIWVVTSAGIPVVSVQNSSKCDTDIISGFLTALQMISESALKSPISRLGMDNSRIYVVKDGDLFVFGKTGVDGNEPRLYRILQEVGREFRKLYGDLPASAYANTARFCPFVSTLRRYS